MAGLSIGLLMMGVQLWLLTVALELYLSGEGDRTWSLALASGAIFLGGLLILALLRRRPAGPPVVIALPEPPLPARIGAPLPHPPVTPLRPASSTPHPPVPPPPPDAPREQRRP